MNRAPPASLVWVDRAAFAAAMTGALRDAGIAPGLGAARRFASALDLVETPRRSDIYWRARICLLADRTELEIFERVFERVFDNLGLPTDPNARRSAGRPMPLSGDRHRRVRGKTNLEAAGGVPWLSPATAIEVGDADGTESTVWPELLPSALADRADTPFDELSEAELEEIGRWLETLRPRWPTRRTRRNRMSAHGRRIDVRRTMARASRAGGEAFDLVRAGPRVRPRRVVMLADVSGSMQSFSRPYLHVMRALGTATEAEVFTFATKLTRVTSALRHRSAADAIARASEETDDRFSGTRIATSIRQLMAHPTWSAFARGAIVVIASDGWDTDPPVQLGARLERLSRMADRIVWVNPRAAADEFQPLVGGMAACLPHIDSFVSGHSLNGMRAVLAAITR